MDSVVPVIWLAIKPKTNPDEEKLVYGLRRLMAEDPTFNDLKT